MSERKTLNLAIEIMKKKRDELARQWQALRQDADLAQEQLNQLTSYALETQTRWDKRSRQATAQMLMQQHFKFFEKLESAISMQMEVVADKDFKCINKKQIWTQAEQRVQILQRYQKRCIEQHQAKVLKVEQKQTDEFAFQWGRHKILKVAL